MINKEADHAFRFTATISRYILLWYHITRIYESRQTESQHTQIIKQVWGFSDSSVE